jgi:hypothetical protein
MFVTFVCDQFCRSVKRLILSDGIWSFIKHDPFWFNGLIINSGSSCPVYLYFSRVYLSFSTVMQFLDCQRKPKQTHQTFAFATCYWMKYWIIEWVKKEFEKRDLSHAKVDWNCLVAWITWLGEGVWWLPYGAGFFWMCNQNSFSDFSRDCVSGGMEIRFLNEERVQLLLVLMAQWFFMFPC